MKELGLLKIISHLSHGFDLIVGEVLDGDGEVVRVLVVADVPHHRAESSDENYWIDLSSSSVILYNFVLCQVHCVKLHILHARPDVIHNVRLAPPLSIPNLMGILIVQKDILNPYLAIIFLAE